MKVIFLDIDGVLNGYGRKLHIFLEIIDKLHLRKWFIMHYDIFGVRLYKVWLLRKIVKKTGAVIVLSSSWRGGWAKDYKYCGSRMKSLKRKFKLFGLTGCVMGSTPWLPSHNRELEIREFIDVYGKMEAVFFKDRMVVGPIKKFVVLDDEAALVPGFVGKELVLTSESDTITGSWREETGLKKKHVKQAIRILNNDDVRGSI